MTKLQHSMHLIVCESSYTRYRCKFTLDTGIKLPNVVLMQANTSCTKDVTAFSDRPEKQL